jgi:hypothetical protein
MPTCKWRWDEVSFVWFLIEHDCAEDKQCSSPEIPGLFDGQEIIATCAVGGEEKQKPAER